MSSRQRAGRAVIAPGENVYVRRGLDILPGTVVSTYETGSGPRAVVRLESEVNEAEEPATVTVPTRDVYRADEAEEIGPPGTWISALSYERQVRDAIHRVVKSLPGNLKVVEGSRPDEPDAVLSGPTATILVEAKFSRKPQIGSRNVEQLERFLRAAERSVEGLVVTNVDIPARLVARLLDSHIYSVKWKSPIDDKRLKSAFRRILFSGSSGDLIDRLEGSQRASTVHDTDSEAQAAGRQMAMQRDVEHVIKKKDSTIAEKNTPQSRDPRQTKG